MNVEDAMLNWVKNMLWDWPTTGTKTRVCRGEGEYFLSHGIPIAHRVGRKIEVSTKRYSNATTRHQRWLRLMIPVDSAIAVYEIKDEKHLFS